ncbi:MAG: TIGR02757 family protein [Bacteroidetes bacterium]|nr:TIGR02757 family protein [Bacteroidota bacterium]
MTTSERLSRIELHSFLEEKVAQYNDSSFIQSDPISIPHQFTKKEDIEISGFITAILSWGQRKAIIQKATLFMQLMDNAPYDFITNMQDPDLQVFHKYVYRTFNAEDAFYMIKRLQWIYLHKGGLEQTFSNQFKAGAFEAITSFRHSFTENTLPGRTGRHLADPTKGSAAKRINMFLRWMVRDDKKGVDFGLWKSLSPSLLICPLDVHSGRVARKLGILTRNQNDKKAAEELTSCLIELDPKDPVKYDFALFGLGVFEKF